jgi:hypothetical protein
MASFKSISKGLGLIPAALSGAFGKENRGFGLGLIPGLLYKDQYKDKEEERRAKEQAAATGDTPQNPQPLVTRKKGGMVKSSASKRADGCAQRGKTRGRIV